MGAQPAMAGSSLSTGDFEVIVVSSDAAGNSTADLSSAEVTIDLQLPNPPTVDRKTTNVTTPKLSGTADPDSGLCHRGRRDLRPWERAGA